MRDTVNNRHGGDPASAAKELGLDSVPSVRLDFSVNINPIGSPNCVAQILARGLDLVQGYPNVHADEAEASLADAHGVCRESIIIGNGSTELFGWIMLALKPETAGWNDPCYSGYEEVCRAYSVGRVDVDDAAIMFIGSPNNPTGELTDPDDIIGMAKAKPERYLIVDESFMDFVTDSDKASVIGRDLPPNLIVVKSLTKFFAIPGLRLGMLCAHPDTAEKIKRVRLPWTINALAQEVACRLYDDRSYIEESLRTVAACRDYLLERLGELDGWKPLPSEANYVVVQLPDGISSIGLQKQLMKKGILIRSCKNFEGLGDSYIRLAVRPKDETDELFAAIKGEQPLGRQRPVMIVGTTSDAGKTVVAAGLCRYFSRKGIKTAPFKAQNMALNSFVTAEGGEMGRAQVVQAQAAGIEPHTDMNPVLLKPMGDAGSQVIVDGEAMGNFPAKDYYKMKDRMKEAAHAAYDRLRDEYEMIILEGAGSPAEINLMEEDFVNMSMAEYAGAHTILVADIDRGGVFASILGTVQILPYKFRRLIKGIIINKFRGDVALLEPGLELIEQLTGIPVLGVLPYMKDLNIEEEDSLGIEKRKPIEGALLDIAVIRLPRISNYTDYMSLEQTKKVSVRYVDDADELGKPDLVILPGTKNTRIDLEFLHETGLADKIVTLVSENVPLFGICGGYQMLGSRVSDPTGVEGEPGESMGLNMLPLVSVLEPRKELAQVEGHIKQALPFARKGTRFSGYEIHAGRTTSTVDIECPLVIDSRRSEETNEAAGAVSDNGLVFGCYVHGLFDSKELREQMLDWLCEQKGEKTVDWEISDINNFDVITDLIETNIDLSRIMP
ncbi:cobyric acid synthase CobQ [bacterium E08(2017)]|nr:cobyric acid synthase CobQ [bacterium E08(2017)]